MTFAVQWSRRGPATIEANAKACLSFCRDTFKHKIVDREHILYSRAGPLPLWRLKEFKELSTHQRPPHAYVSSHHTARG